MVNGSSEIDSNSRIIMPHHKALIVRGHHLHISNSNSKCREVITTSAGRQTSNKCREATISSSNRVIGIGSVVTVRCKAARLICIIRDLLSINNTSSKVGVVGDFKGEAASKKEEDFKAEEDLGDEDFRAEVEDLGDEVVSKSFIQA